MSLTATAPWATSFIGRPRGGSRFCDRGPGRPCRNLPDVGECVVRAAAANARLRSGRLHREKSTNVGLIHGGKARNIVPDRAEVAVEVRSIDRGRLENEIRGMVGAFEEAAATAGAMVKVRREVSFEAFAIAETHPVVANAFRAARSLGIEARLWTTGAGMEPIFNLRGCPAWAGIGIEDSHSPKEHIAADEMGARRAPLRKRFPVAHGQDSTLRDEAGDPSAAEMARRFRDGKTGWLLYAEINA